MKVLNADLIKKSEEKAVLSGIFSFRELMYIAGKKASECLLNKYNLSNKRIAVFCGSGNNGGDGFVIAKALYEYGCDVTVFIPMGFPNTPDAKFYFEALPPVKIKNNLFDEEFDFVIDAIFGIGLSRPLDSSLTHLIKKINSLKAVKISIDVPSGVEADSGKILPIAIKADFTVTFIALKPCFLLPFGSDYCGEVAVLDIGVSPINSLFTTIEKPVFPERSHNCHKGSFGTALLINGSFGMSGAAMLSAKASLRSGVGIVKSVLPKSIYYPFTVFCPEAVCIPVNETKDGHILAESIDINSLCNGSTALLFGCGIGVSEDTYAILKKILKNANIPIVLDADGINLLSRNIELLKESKAPVILTPHPKEMSRLCKTDVKSIEENRIDIAKKFATDYNCTLVLKGANTIVATANGEIFVNTIGNSGMATAGSGDVLSGITVSLLAQGYAIDFAVKSAVYLHSHAADKALKKRQIHSLIASDIIEEL